jgi:TPR repeat protein
MTVSLLPSAFTDPMRAWERSWQADATDGGRAALQALGRAGDVAAMFRLAMCYRLGVGGAADDALAAAWLWAAAKGGHAEAQLVLGLSCYEGRGVERDKRQAVRWYRRAAQQGLPRAQHWLARSLFLGEGCEIDLPEAYYWALAAESNGFPDHEFGGQIARHLPAGERERIERGLRPERKQAAIA